MQQLFLPEEAQGASDMNAANHSARFVIIVNYNGRKHLEVSLPSLMRALPQDYKILVVDNGSVDGSLSYIEKNFPSVFVLRSDINLGFSLGNNLGIRFALEQGADRLLLLNNDAVVEVDCIVELERILAACPSVGIVGPKVLGEDCKIQAAGGIVRVSLSDLIWNLRSADTWKCVKHIGQGEADDGSHNEPLEVDYVPGCAMLLKSEVIRKIGFFDDVYTPAYYEEVDLCLRAKALGYTVAYAPKARLTHKAAGTLGVGSLGAMHLMERNMTTFGLRNLRAADLVKFVVIELLRFFLVPAKYLAKCEPSRAQCFIRAKLDACNRSCSAKKRMKEASKRSNEPSNEGRPSGSTSDTYRLTKRS